jgi:large conductance mechanosensitive channel
MANGELSGQLTRMGGAARGWGAEFKAFLLKHQVLGLAIGVVIGGAIGRVVTGVVDDVIMPIVGVVLPGGDWRSAQLVLSGTNAIKYGDLIGRIVDFVVIAAVVFLTVKAFIERTAAPPAPAVPTKACPQCLETIPAAARRCRACASDV